MDQNLLVIGIFAVAILALLAISPVARLVLIDAVRHPLERRRIIRRQDGTFNVEPAKDEHHRGASGV